MRVSNEEEKFWIVFLQSSLLYLHFFFDFLGFVVFLISVFRREILTAFCFKYIHVS